MGHIRLLRFMPMIAGRVILFPLSVTISAQYDHDIELHQFEGNMGKSRIGMTVARRGNTIEGGHYFYQKFLQDIPIAGSVTDSHITLTEPGGGTFHLRFVDNGSEGSQSLDFENSVGMDGNWTSAGGSRTYSVSLRGATILSVADARRRYSEVTRESDQTFERHVQSFWHATLRGDRAAAAKFISYPLRVNFPDHSRKSYQSPTAVLSAWNNLFTPTMMAKLREALPHDMFVHDSMAMLGDGEEWFDDKGLAVLNVLSPSAKLSTR